MTKLLCVIGLLLLSCGVVEAQQDLYTDCIHKAPDGTVYDICRMPDMRKILSESKSCEDKMKDMMREVDGILKFNHESLNSRKPGEARVSLNLSPALYLRWSNVIKECVQ